MIQSVIHAVQAAIHFMATTPIYHIWPPWR